MELGIRRVKSASVDRVLLVAALMPLRTVLT